MGPTLEDAQKGNTSGLPIPERIPPAQEEWWKVNSSINLNTFSFAANFDSGVSFKLPFYIDKNVKKILDIGLTLVFQKFRVDSTPLPHSHTVTVPDHTHDVSIPNHTHDVSIPAHTHTINATVTNGAGTGTSAHQHTVLVDVTGTSAPSLEALGYKYLMVQPSSGGEAQPCTGTSGGIPLQLGKLWAANSAGVAFTDQVSFKTNCTIQDHTHTINATATVSGGGSTQTSSAGGGTTVSSAAGGGTTVSSSTVAGAQLGIAEGTYPTSVRVYLDGNDITANLGGPFNPNATTNVFADLDITPFVTEGGLHVLEFTTTTTGRCLPVLWVKSIITRQGRL